MRFFSYVYHGLLALFLLALSFLAIVSNSHTLRLEMLPWTGEALTYWLLGGGVAGLIAVVLAVKGKVRIVFLAWSVVVLLMLVKGYVFSSYRFTDGYTTALLLMAGALLAVAGAWFQFRAEALKRKRY